MGDDDPIKRRVFVDFMYALVVGSALPLINGEHLSWSDPVFFGTLFLIVVVLEDYFLYMTQIVPYQRAGEMSLIPLFSEIAILVSWYLAVVASPKYPRFFLYAIFVFFVLKYFAGLAHWKEFRRWESRRNLAFLIPAGTVLILDHWFRPTEVDGYTILGLAVAWLLMVAIWWGITVTRPVQRHS